MESYARSNENSELFRFVSFFDLYDILVNRRLRFSKLSTFPDRNEGVGRILWAQDNDTFRWTHINSTDIASAYENILENNYLSCWTTESELMAMWALYSPDCSSIRISTTAGKLRSALGNLNEKMSWSKAIDEPGSRKQVSRHCSLEPVEYVDFFALRNEIRKKYQLFEQKISTAQHQNENYHSDGFKKDYEEFLQQKIIKRDGLFLKDKAYVHENEVRAALYFGVRNNRPFKEYHPLFKGLTDNASVGELPDFLYADVDEHFVDTVCFDPRMPRYKRHIFESILTSSIPEVRESRVFGCALDQDSFASDFEGNPSV